MRRSMSIYLSVFALLFTFAMSAQAAGVHGVLRVVKGKVQIKDGKNGKISRAKVGQKVLPQDTVITGPDSRAKIVMIDNNEINVSPDSEITFEKYEYNPDAGKKNVLLNVIYGKVRSKVEQKYDDKTSKFQVKTPSAVAGVRGTDFLTSFDPGTKSTNVVTFHGTVALGNGSGQVLIGKGQTASVARGRVGRVVSVPKSELASADASSDAEKGGSSNNDKRSPSSNDNGESEKKDEGGDKNSDAGDKQGGAQGEGGGEQSGGGDKADTSGGDAAAGGDSGGQANGNGGSGRGDSGNGSASDGGQANGGAQGGSASADGGARSPASTGPADSPSGAGDPAGGPSGGSMINSGDLVGGPQGGATGPSAPKPPVGALLPVLPPTSILPKVPDSIPKCEFCNQVINNGPAKVRVIVK